MEVKLTPGKHFVSVNVSGILCTSARTQNFAEGLGHTGNDVTYTRSHIRSLIWFECMTNF